LQSALWIPLLKALPACLLMAGAVASILTLVEWQQPGEVLLKSSVLTIAVVVGVLIYLGSCLLFGVDELRQGWQLIRQRKSARGIKSD